MASQSDRVFYGVMLAAAAVGRFTADDVDRILQDVLEDDERPSRKTVQNRIRGLEEVDVLTISETAGRARYTHYKLNSLFTDEF